MAGQAPAKRRYLTELIGTFLFTFAVIGILATPGCGTVGSALGVGAALMVMVYASGHVSGGHLNPSVSIAAYLRGALSLDDLGPYIAAQLLGALAAFGAGSILWHDKYFGQSVDLGGKLLAALVAELIFTFALCYIVLHTATSKDTAGNSFYGLAIGFVVTVGVLAVGGVSGASFNPAITFGLMLAGMFSWKFVWVYLLAEVLGATLAAYAYRATALDGRRGGAPAGFRRR
jgi:aquaporin Z